MKVEKSLDVVLVLVVIGIVLSFVPMGIKVAHMRSEATNTDAIGCITYEHPRGSKTMEVSQAKVWPGYIRVTEAGTGKEYGISFDYVLEYYAEEK